MDRLTNPSIQRLWSLFPFLSNRWNHYDQWMVILQKWEPTISDTFTSKIPFWIDIQGLPKHYWHQDMLKAIGVDLGEILDFEITNSSAKLKVFVDGLKSLVLDTMVDFLMKRNSVQIWFQKMRTLQSSDLPEVKRHPRIWLEIITLLETIS